MSLNLHLVHLYPQEMNIYGDNGNRLILQRRCQWRGIDVKTSLVGVGDPISPDADIILGGGAQDAVQQLVERDLKTKAADLSKMADDGVVMLMVCGMYQLFGRHFITSQHQKIEGLAIFQMDTLAGSKRFIGNTIYQTDWGVVVGYENHSGQTALDNTAQALGRVKQGAGNNGRDKTEGCIYKNVFGTYSHGPVLSKNPQLADELIKRALVRVHGVKTLKSIDDTLEQTAARVAQKRPR